MLRGYLIAAAAAAAFALAPVGASAAESSALDQVKGLTDGWTNSYEAGAKYYVKVRPVYRPVVYVKPRPVIYVKPRPVYYYKVKRPKVYIY